ncbi:MAG: DinB family protein [Pirellulales bacterium]|nr:DinB family protein [Pirellulales bacterium]
MSSIIDLYVQQYEFFRERTLATLDRVRKMSDPNAALRWRPGAGRAHVGWQLMHIAITEEIFATERLAPAKQGEWLDLWPRFRGGSTPDDKAPTAEMIFAVMKESREHLLATLSEYTEERLDEIPEALQERGWTVQKVLDVIAWHEGHHQGQAHLTLNLFEAL